MIHLLLPAFQTAKSRITPEETKEKKRLKTNIFHVKTLAIIHLKTHKSLNTSDLKIGYE